MFAWLMAFLSLGATFTIAPADVTAIGSGATDTANSLVSAIATLLPVLIPLLVVGFIIGMVMGAFRSR